jgi:hypothetical protein
MGRGGTRTLSIPQRAGQGSEGYCEEVFVRIIRRGQTRTL